MARKFSQEKLAELAEVHPNYIGDIERGEENVSVDVLVRIATVFDSTVSELTEGF